MLEDVDDLEALVDNVDRQPVQDGSNGITRRGVGVGATSQNGRSP
jgi:hypothetical protein